MRFLKSRLIAILISLITYSSVNFIFANEQHSNKLKIVTSFSILEDIARNIGKDKVSVMSLVGRNQDAHTFTPSPDHFKMLTNADIFIMNGLGFEGWITRTIDASGFNGLVVVASKNIKPLDNATKQDEHSNKSHPIENHSEHSHEHEHEHEHEHSHENSHAHEQDPHVWQDPKNVIILAQNITAAFIEKDPANTEFFNANLAEYTKELNELDTWAKVEFAKIDHANRTILMRHDAFGYLAKAYDFHIVSIMNANANKEPSAKEITKLAQLIKSKNIRIAFSENIDNDRLINALGKDFNIQQGAPLLSDALTLESENGATYSLFFKHNVNKIIEGLQSTAKK
jgi:ABC-type Zn uptake system ZnuABC Zn-binding protein ZnuA